MSKPLWVTKTGVGWLLALLVSVLACKDAPPTPKTPMQKRVCQEKNASVSLRLILDPESPGIGRHNLEILVKDTNTNLFVEAEEPEVVPWMPLHGHGVSVAPTMTRVFKGKYRFFPVVFSMSGDWELHISMKVKGRQVIRCAKINVGQQQVKDSPTPTKEIPKDSTPPLLEQAPVYLAGNYDPSTKQLGSLMCDQHSACFQTFRRETKTFGAFTFVTKPGTAVYAVTAGVVESIQWIRHSHQTHADIFRLVTKANPDAAFAIEYNNIKGVKVKVGQHLKVGQTIAETGDGDDPKRTWMSLRIKRQQESQQWLCPTNYASDRLKRLLANVAAQLKQNGIMDKDNALCQSRSLLCPKESCQKKEDVIAVQGDIDAGRRIYQEACASCHGNKGEGGIGTDMCSGPGCQCSTCKSDHKSLANRVALDMPPEGSCTGTCAEDVSAFIRQAFQTSPP